MNFKRNSNIFIEDNTFENSVCEMFRLGLSVLKNDRFGMVQGWWCIYQLQHLRCTCLAGDIVVTVGAPPLQPSLNMMTSCNVNIFRVTGPLCEEIHRPPVNSSHKGQWRGALMFSLICAWTNGWVNNLDAGNLRRNRANYDVTVMELQNSVCNVIQPMLYFMLCVCLNTNSRNYS